MCGDLRLVVMCKRWDVECGDMVTCSAVIWYAVTGDVVKCIVVKDNVTILFLESSSFLHFSLGVSTFPDICTSNPSIHFVYLPHLSHALLLKTLAFLLVSRKVHLTYSCTMCSLISVNLLRLGATHLIYCIYI